MTAHVVDTTPNIAHDGLAAHVPSPWSVVRVDLGEEGSAFHLVDARGHTILSSSGVNRLGSDSQRAILDRIAAAVNAVHPDVLELARIVVRSDERGVSSSTHRHQASAMLAQHIAGTLA